MKGVVITTADEVSVRDFTAPLHESLGAVVGGCIEIVHPQGLKSPYCMIVNDEGLLKKLPLNRAGSLLYGTQFHGSPIVGDIVIMADGWTPEGRDIGRHYRGARRESGAGTYQSIQVERSRTMIRNPNEIQEGAKKIRMLIAGYPGIGKSTLALSAPRPLHIDVDFGIDRIEPRYRKPYIQPKSYDEILEDLTPINVQDFDTLVFDTGGKLISLMSQWAIKKDVKYGQRDGSLSLKGYGFIGREFQRLMDYCFYELDKHIVVVFHAIEEKDGDNTRLRIKVEGQTKNNVWEPMDLGGFVEIQGNNRTIGFSNCERYFAKGTRGIHGVWQVPELGPDKPNDFLTRLFAQYNALSAAEVAQNEKEQEAYEAAMAEGQEIVAGITDADSANAAMSKIKAVNHALTSKKEVNAAFNAKIKELGLFYDKVLKKYTPAPTEGEKGAE